MFCETIATRSGMPLTVETSVRGEQLEVSFRSPDNKRCLLHWESGISTGTSGNAAEALWPPGTQPVGQSAVQTPFPNRTAKWVSSSA